MDYSVLMPVYYKENPEYFKESIESMLSQTVPTDNFVIVCDGELTDELTKVLDTYRNNPVITIVQLEKNMGLAKALTEGLKYCKNELVARMDSDDISLPERCKKQLEIFSAENIDVVGSNVLEFIDDADNALSIRCVPETHEKIKIYAKKRNPMNHPSVMFKKSLVIKNGCYQNFRLYEDYQLWVKMIINGCKFKNIQEPLVKMRTTNDLYMRRGGLKYFKNGCALQSYMYKSGYISAVRYIKNLIERFMVQVLMPNHIRKWFYLRVLREDKK
ncbi:MAG: glycosyltransferase [Clostridia bacterium]|nr:glycosyltransferase [Clostridia bacterium]